MTSLTTPAGIIRGDDGTWYATTPGASDDLRIGPPPLVWLNGLGDEMAAIEFEDGSIAAKPAKGEPWDEPSPPGCMAAHFARRINNALRLRHSSPRRAILAYLRRIATDDGLVAISHATIARQTGVARSSVPFLMDEMVALGHLAIVRRGTSAGQPTCYRIAD